MDEDVSALSEMLNALQRAVAEQDPYPELALRVQDARALLSKIEHPF